MGTGVRFAFLDTCEIVEFSRFHGCVYTEQRISMGNGA